MKSGGDQQRLRDADAVRDAARLSLAARGVRVYGRGGRSGVTTAWLVAFGSGSLVELEWLDEVVACRPERKRAARRLDQTPEEPTHAAQHAAQQATDSKEKAADRPS